MTWRLVAKLTLVVAAVVDITAVDTKVNAAVVDISAVTTKLAAAVVDISAVDTKEVDFTGTDDDNITSDNDLVVVLKDGTSLADNAANFLRVIGQLE